MSIRVQVSASGDDTVVALSGSGNTAVLVHLADGVGAIARSTRGRVFVDVGGVELLGAEPEADGLGAFVDRLLIVADGRSALVASPGDRHDLLVRAGIAQRIPVHRSAPPGAAPR